jgi:cell division protein FtsL
VARLNFILLVALGAFGLGLVTSQHQARKLFIQLEREQARAKALEVEFGQLQLEASTWAAHARVESLARERLRMSPPDPRRTQVIEQTAAGER